MKYVTGIHALNLPCKLETCGDWHTSALKWENISWGDTDTSLFGEYGIETDHSVPNLDGLHCVANHIRACLDLLVDGKFTVAQGMHNDYIDNEQYTPEVFKMVYLLRDRPNWHEIDEFMGKEYEMEWVRYKEAIKLKKGNYNSKKEP